MACKKYAGWVTDCALGQLAASRKAELMAHVRDCADCREALERARQAAELADRGVELLVAGEPSAQFAARLRSRIAEESPTRIGLTRRLAVAASVALCLALVGVAAVNYLKGDARPAPAPAPRVSAVPSGSVKQARTATGAVAAIERRRVKQARLRRREAASAGARVLVQPGQMAALDELYEALQREQDAGARAVGLGGDADEPIKIPPIAVKPLELQPIEVPTVSIFGDSWPGL